MPWKKKKQIPTVATLARPILDSFLRKKMGFGQEFIASWEHIVGQNYSRTSYPLKIIWAPVKQNIIQSSTLVVASMTGGTQLYLQHNSREILLRANMFFGYSALTKLKVKSVQEISE